MELPDVQARRAPLILVVDDEDFIALLISELLLDLDYDVQTAYNGRDAIALLERSSPDLVISDVMMPLASGLQLVEAMRERDQTRHTPVILMSAATAPNVADEQVSFIRKPFNLQSIVEQVSRKLAASTRRSGSQPAGI